MPKISRQARRALTEERRKQILSAAAQVFAEKGFERATIADIAKAAGIAEGSIYNYFKSKSDLLLHIPRQAIQPTIESLNTQMTALSGERPPEQMLATLARQMVNTIHQNAPVFRILLSTLPTMSQAARENYLNHVILYALSMLESYFDKQIKQGVLRRDADAKTLARAFAGMFLPFVALRDVLQVESEQAADYDELIAKLSHLFLHGALANAPKRKSK
jgi:AcrR family transcriptional regulator